MNPLTFGSLFAGIGGIDLGLERAGMVCKWQVEKDPFCQKVLTKHWPNVAKYGDVINVGAANLEPVDVIAGGFPCQPHSLAGKRRGAEDDRNLWPEYSRVIRELKPAWVIGENVPGIKTTILDDVLSDLESMDYQTRTLVIPACAFNAPHIRERVFILAHANSNRRHRSAAWHSTPDKKRDDQARQSRGEKEFHAALPGGKDMAHAESQRCRETGIDRQRSAEWVTGSSALRHTTGEGLSNRISSQVGGCTKENPELQPERSNWWAVEPGMGRVADGIPNRVDRLRGLGNAVVPQVAEWIGALIIEAQEGSL